MIYSNNFLFEPIHFRFTLFSAPQRQNIFSLILKSGLVIEVHFPRCRSIFRRPSENWVKTMKIIVCEENSEIRLSNLLDSQTLDHFQQMPLADYGSIIFHSKR